MTVKTYQAYSMAEALAAVRRDLGADALIISTRAFKRGGILGLGRQTIVEVTATPAAANAAPAPVAARRGRRTDAKRRLAAQLAYATKTAARGTSKAGRGVAPSDAKAGPRVERPDPVPTISASQAAAPAPTAASAAAPAAASAVAEVMPVARVVPDRASLPKGPVDTPPRSADRPRRFILTPEGVAGHGGAPAGMTAAPEPKRAQPVAVPPVVVGATEPTPVSSSSPGATGIDTRAMQEELSAIRTMVGQVLERHETTRERATPSLPPVIFDSYLKMIAQDLSEELADRVVAEVRRDLTTSEQEEPESVQRAMRRRLANCIPVAEEPLPSASPDGRPLTIALIGPTGVGKTTTLAKLAATYKLRHRRRVGLVTSDTYRIAAVDQLRTYANIIGLPLEVVLTPAEMDRAMQGLADREVILVDTAGRSQNDAERLAELRAFMAAANPHEVHLVLSGTAGEKVLLREAEAFGAVGFDKIVLTKLDEAVSFGMLVNVIRQVGKKLSFITTGQEVPDHLEVGRADRLAELVMGGAVHA